MATEEQIKELAHTIWQQEGEPEGKDLEHYFRARKILEDKEIAPVIQLPASAPPAQLVPPSSKRSFGRRGKR